jgi:hypothetical protein
MAPIIYPEERFVSTGLDNPNKIVAFIANRFKSIQICKRIDKDFIRIIYTYIKIL